MQNVRGLNADFKSCDLMNDSKTVAANLAAEQMIPSHNLLYE